MKFQPFDPQFDHPISKRNLQKLEQIKQIIAELETKDIKQSTVEQINWLLLKIKDGKKKRNTALVIRGTLHQIQKVLEKEEGIVLAGYYQNLWMAVGLSIGVAIGSAIGIGSQNMAFSGIGLPIGLAVGIALGKQKDDKAKQDGKQLNLTLKA